jgi:glycerophosphoryl diester phosphodiesterase
MTQPRRPLLLGHRGARRGVPENTFAAFDKALGDGCDGFEFDARLTADGRPVICHDPRLHGLEIAKSTLAALAAAVAAEKSLSAGSSSEKPHCLEEVLAVYGQRAYLDIELKVAGLEEAALEALQRCPAARGAVISSFLPEVLLRLAERQADRTLAAGVSLGLIFDKRESLCGWERLPISHLMPRHDLLDKALLSELHAAGKQVFAWTVNRAQEMRRLAELGVDGLISDDPELLSRTFAGG